MTKFQYFSNKEFVVFFFFLFVLGKIVTSLLSTSPLRSHPLSLKVIGCLIGSRQWLSMREASSSFPAITPLTVPSLKQTSVFLLLTIMGPRMQKSLPSCDLRAGLSISDGQAPSLEPWVGWNQTSLKMLPCSTFRVTSLLWGHEPWVLGAAPPSVPQQLWPYDQSDSPGCQAGPWSWSGVLYFFLLKVI